MRTYKQRTIDFVEEMNMAISDPLMFPEYKGSKFELSFEEKDDELSCILFFKELEDKFSVYRKTFFTKFQGGDNESLFGSFHIGVVRTVLFAIDTIGELTDPETGMEINVLSLNTLANEGLKKWREYNLNK